MSVPGQSRKLAAILAADVAGYSRLMGDDEQATVQTLTDYRRVFSEHIQRHQGHVVDTAGDSVLAAFDSPVEAVECAVAIQKDLTRKNRNLADHRKMQFRIGINLGDVITREEGTVYGDGVNIAARLESLGEPGGLMVSGSVYDQVKNRVQFAFQSTGEHEVKNIAEPVHAYRVIPEGSPDGAPTGSAAKPARSSRITIGVIAVAVAMLVVGGIWNYLYRQTSSEAKPATQTSAVTTLSDGPSIAVLPFANMSGDTEQEYFADGISEDLITALAKFQRLLVIARNSSFQYKGKTVDVRAVARDLGVRYVLEGSIRKDRNRVRVTAQLIDATRGTHLWAENYDRELTDIFSIQDEIIRHIIRALDVQLVEGEQSRRWRRTTDNLAAYEHFLRGRDYILRFTKEDFALAEEEFQQAIKLDPKFAMAYTQYTSVPLLMAILGFSEDPEKDLDRAYALQTKGIELDPTIGYSFTQLGRIHMQRREIDKALEYGEKGVTLEPNSGSANAVYAHMLEAAARPEESLNFIRRSYRVSPIPESWLPWLEGTCLRRLGRYEEAVTAYQRSIALAPKFLWPHVYMVDAYVAVGKLSEAKTKANEVLAMQPDFSVDKFMSVFVWHKEPEHLKSYAANMRVAGLK